MLSLCEVFLESVKKSRRDAPAAYPPFNNQHDWFVEGSDNEEISLR
jgi:hypothetical protein